MNAAAVTSLDMIATHRTHAEHPDTPPGARAAAVALAEFEVVSARTAGATIETLVNTSGFTEARVLALVGETHTPASHRR